MFKTEKINYAIIVLGGQKTEGECTYWSIINGTGTCRLIVEGKEFIVGINNVILTEK